MSNDTQLRGHCPYCGRLQAVPNGLLAYHGYTVPNGWRMFVGGCGAGQTCRPLELDREACDKFCAELIERAEQDEARALAFERGEINPSGVPPYIRKRGEPDLIPWEDANEYEREHGVKLAIHQNRQAASMARSHVEMLQKLADRVHGQPLMEVKRDDRPAPINTGEQRRNSRGDVLTVKGVERGRVYYYFDRGGDKPRGVSWSGIAAWRKFPLVEGGE